MFFSLHFISIIMKASQFLKMCMWGEFQAIVCVCLNEINYQCINPRVHPYIPIVFCQYLHINKNVTFITSSVLCIRGQRPISVRTYFRHICSLGVNFMQLRFFVLN